MYGEKTMTRKEKIRKINKLYDENRIILEVIKTNNIQEGFSFYFCKYEYKFKKEYRVNIDEELFNGFAELLEKRVDENNKELDELLGVDDD